MTEKTMLNTNFPKLNFFRSGKVRDIYDLGNYYLIISTDRLSAFDVVMNQPIPKKGRVLNQISDFWFSYTKEIIQNHIVTTDANQYPEICDEYREDLLGRSMLVKKTKVIMVECIVRGYLSGTGWNDYQNSGKLCGIELPIGMLESEKLEEPIFTPSTKAEIGGHDENISEEIAIKLIGLELYNEIKTVALRIYKKAYEYAFSKGIILADSKMEFGIDESGKLMLIDELLTPDSSRFWNASKYKKGGPQESFDKQFVRDYLLSINFNKQPPPPDLPDEIIKRTSEKYIEVLKILTGKEV